MQDDVNRSRFVREVLLKTLHAADVAGAALGLRLNDILVGAARSTRSAFREPVVRAELNDLVQTGLVGKKWDEGLLDDFYFILAGGRDFVRANFPWSQIDRFTGCM